jgi:hypothetical protein
MKAEMRRAFRAMPSRLVDVIRHQISTLSLAPRIQLRVITSLTRTAFSIRPTNYDNDATGWVRGCRSGEPSTHNEDATSKPGFDFGGAWRTDRKTGMRDQIKDYHADHNRHHTEFEHKHNAGVTHTTEAHDFSKRHVPSYERRGELGLNRHSEPKSRR